MTLAHNIFIRNLNAIYLQCAHVNEPTDITDLLTFCKAFYLALHHHHWGEEQFFFPAVEAYTKVPGIMEANVNDHQAFDAGLEKFHDYVTTVKPEEYDAVTFKGLLDGFAVVLERHLRAEIETLLALDKYGGKELKKAWDDLESAVMKDMKNQVRLRDLSPFDTPYFPLPTFVGYVLSPFRLFWIPHSDYGTGISLTPQPRGE